MPDSILAKELMKFRQAIGCHFAWSSGRDCVDGEMQARRRGSGGLPPNCGGDRALAALRQRLVSAPLAPIRGG